MPETTVSPKEGDTVRVTWIGRVNVADDGYALVLAENASIGSAYVPIDVLEVLAPPVKAGDPAPLAVLDELPHGSVVIAAGGLVAQLTVSRTTGDRIWRIPGAECFTKPAMIANWPATVLLVGNGS